MKLSAHYNKASIIIALSVLLIGSVIYYFAINYVATSELDHDLSEEIDEVNDYVKLNHRLPDQSDMEDLAFFKRTSQNYIPQKYFDTVCTSRKEKENVQARAVSGLITLNGVHYKFTITDSKKSTKYLISIIATITLLLTVGLLLILFITNRYVLNGLWKPFYKTLNGMKVFNVSENDVFDLHPSKVDEFNELNEVMQLMSSRVKNDFQNLKSFTENASHEMQTPLAVITSKLDTIIQDETIKPDLYDQINDIYAATSKLSRLNQSLLLLVKIENNMMDDVEWVDLDILIIEKVKLFQDLLLSKNIGLKKELDSKKVMVSKYLVDVLLNNLFSNAIRHNADDGQIIIKLTGTQLSFQNIGIGKELDSENVFERFQKGKKSDGTGLGLAIVKNICSFYKWDINYEYRNSLHTFLIRF